MEYCDVLRLVDLYILFLTIPDTLPDIFIYTFIHTIYIYILSASCLWRPWPCCILTPNPKRAREPFKRSPGFVVAVFVKFQRALCTNMYVFHSIFNANISFNWNIGWCYIRFHCERTVNTRKQTGPELDSLHERSWETKGGCVCVNLPTIINVNWKSWPRWHCGDHQHTFGPHYISYLFLFNKRRGHCTRLWWSHIENTL